MGMWAWRGQEEVSAIAAQVHFSRSGLLCKGSHQDHAVTPMPKPCATCCLPASLVDSVERKGRRAATPAQPCPSWG